MGTKTISITDSAYQQLVKKRRAGESFSDVILRLIGHQSLHQSSRLVSKEEGDALRAAVEDNQEERRKRRQARIGGAA